MRRLSNAIMRTASAVEPMACLVAADPHWYRDYWLAGDAQRLRLLVGWPVRRVRLAPCPSALPITDPIVSALSAPPC